MKKMKMKKEEKAIQIIRCPKCGHEGYVWKHDHVEIMCKDCGEAFQVVAEIPLSIVLAMIEDVEDE